MSIRPDLLGLLIISATAAACGGGEDAAAPAPGGDASATSPGSDQDGARNGSGTLDGSTPDSGDAAAPVSAIPFSAMGVWRTKLPATTPVASNSAALAAQIKKDITENYGTWSINTDTFSSSYYSVPANAPVQDWTWNNCQGKVGPPFPGLTASLRGIPTQADFVASKGSDGEIAIYSASLDTYWDFWQARVDGAGHWSACWGGKIEHASQNSGIFPKPLGAVACGLPLAGWLLRIAELQAGVVGHALGFQVVHTRKTEFSWPANRTDGNTSGADYPMEGQRFRLDPTFDVSTLPNAAERTIAKGLQDYGMILTDTSGAVTLQAEDPRPYAAAHGGVNPYPALWSNLPAYSVLKDIPIAKLQALPKDYGQDFMQ